MKKPSRGRAGMVFAEGERARPNAESRLLAGQSGRVSEGNCQENRAERVFYTASTIFTSGTFAFNISSIPDFKVSCDKGHPWQVPRSFTKTTPFSNFINSTLPACIASIGLIDSRACSIFCSILFSFFFNTLPYFSHQFSCRFFIRTMKSGSLSKIINQFGSNLPWPLNMTRRFIASVMF